MPAETITNQEAIEMMNRCKAEIVGLRATIDRLQPKADAYDNMAIVLHLLPLMAHMRRWKRLDGKKAEFVITYQGKRVKNPIRIWDETRRAAGLPTYITPHILRHTRATNMMQQRKDPWEAAKALGMSLDMLTEVYGHHHPDWQKDVSETR